MATKDQIIETIKRCYRHDRLEGRNNDTWGTNYSQIMIADRLGDIARYGETLISCHESVTGQAVRVLADGTVI